MFLETKAYTKTKLGANSALTTALGGADKISTLWPNSFENVPMLVYSEDLQVNSDFYDNAVVGNRSNITIHIFTAWTAKTTTIAKLVDAVMSPLLWTLTGSGDLDNPKEKARHRVMKYERSALTEGDLV